MQEFSPHGRFILSADRDFKIRVSYIISKFVSAIAFYFFTNNYIHIAGYLFSQESLKWSSPDTKFLSRSYRVRVASIILECDDVQ